jgi:HEAT repeat protein
MTASIADEKTTRFDGVDRIIISLGDDDGLVRQAARIAAVTAGEVTVPGLIQTLQSNNPDARWEAAKALTELRDQRAIPALVAALTDDLPGVRWLAAEALLYSGRPALEPLLHSLIEHSHSVWFREGAHHVLRGLARGDLRDAIAPVLKALDGIEPEIGVLVPAYELLKAPRRAIGGQV